MKRHKSDDEKISFHKKRNSRVWWVGIPGDIGTKLFTFDKRKIYSYYLDYPDKLTPEEREIFKENEPFWAKFKGQ